MYTDTGDYWSYALARVKLTVPLQCPNTVNDGVRSKVSTYLASCVPVNTLNHWEFTRWGHNLLITEDCSIHIVFHACTEAILPPQHPQDRHPAFELEKVSTSSLTLTLRVTASIAKMASIKSCFNDSTSLVSSLLNVYTRSRSWSFTPVSLLVSQNKRLAFKCVYTQTWQVSMATSKQTSAYVHNLSFVLLGVICLVGRSHPNNY